MGTIQRSQSVWLESVEQRRGGRLFSSCLPRDRWIEDCTRILCTRLAHVYTSSEGLVLLFDRLWLALCWVLVRRPRQPRQVVLWPWLASTFVALQLQCGWKGLGNRSIEQSRPRRARTGCGSENCCLVLQDQSDGRTSSPRRVWRYYSLDQRTIGM